MWGRGPAQLCAEVCAAVLFQPLKCPGDRNGSFPGGSFLSGQHPRGGAWPGGSSLECQREPNQGPETGHAVGSTVGAVQRVELCSRRPEKALSQSVKSDRQTAKMCTEPPAAGHHPGTGIPSEQMQGPQGAPGGERSWEGCNHQGMPSKHSMTVDSEYSETEKLAGPILHSLSTLEAEGPRGPSASAPRETPLTGPWEVSGCRPHLRAEDTCPGPSQDVTGQGYSPPGVCPHESSGSPWPPGRSQNPHLMLPAPQQHEEAVGCPASSR